MTDGSAALMTLTHSLRAQGRWGPERGSNLLDGGTPFYDVYETADGKHVSVGCLEPQFFDALLQVLGVDDFDRSDQMRPDRWPAMRNRFDAIFRTRDRDDWERAFDGSEACFAPVLTMDEAPSHPHNAARGTYVELPDGVQPAPAPRFGGSPPPNPDSAAASGRAHTCRAVGVGPRRTGRADRVRGGQPGLTYARKA